MTRLTVHMSVNGLEYDGYVEPRRSLADFIREDLGLTGTHIGCEQGVCGACTLLVDGRSVRSCLMLAVQARGSSIETIESLASPEGTLSPLQQAFTDEHGLQCGYCTPGFLMTAKELLDRNPDPTEDEIRAEIAGNLCRCTGYHTIVMAISTAAEYMRKAGESAAATDA